MARDTHTRDVGVRCQHAQRRVGSGGSATTGPLPGPAAIADVLAGEVDAVSPSQHSAWLTPCIGQPEVTQAAWPWT
jgi:hypothetical protein